LYLTSFSFCCQLLVKEQELVERADALKEASGQVESLKVEVTRLRRYEEELANLQVAPKNPVLHLLLVEFFFGTNKIAQFTCQVLF
jgi:hypothetical protein